MRPNRVAVFLSVFLLSLFLQSVAWGDEAAGEPAKKPEGKIVLSLDQCIKKAVEISPEIGESRYDVETYKAKKDQADSARYPQIDLLALTGPSEHAQREEFFQTTHTSNSINGIFGSADVMLVQPIYTFGKISSYREAASGGIKVAEAGVSKKTSDIVLRTKELYYSILLAKDTKNLLLEIKDELVKSKQKAEKHIEQGSQWADPVQLYKLNTFLGEVNKNLNETDKGITLANDALLTSMGIPKGTEFDTADASLSREEMVPDNLNTYTMISRSERPEFVQLSEGMKAKSALVDAEKSNYYPQIFFGIKASLAGATNRERLQNPYVLDYFNHSYALPVLGLKWSLDFGITKGKVREAEVEYLKLTEKKRFADEAIPFQVRKAYLDFEESNKNIGETESAYKDARKWLVAEVANFDLGVADAKDVGDAAAAYAQMKSNYLRSLYNNRMSYANLLYASGVDLKGLK